MEIVALVVSLAALGASGFAAWFAKGQRDAAVASAVEAKRSADAAETATDIQRQAHDAAAEARRQEREAARYQFRLAHAGGALWQLTNDGTDIAFDVHATIEGEATTDGRDASTPELGGGDRLDLYLVEPSATRIHVTWRSSVGDQSEPRTQTILPRG